MTERMRNGIVKRGSTWSYVVRERDPQTGKTKPRWVGGSKTRKEAEEKRDAARHASHRGTYVAPQSLTVATYLDRWIKAHEVELKPSTAASYRAKIESYLKPAMGHERLQSLSQVGSQSSFATCTRVAGRTANRSPRGRWSLLARCCGGH